MKTVVLPAWYDELPMIFGTQDWSQASPVATSQSCMSLQMFGVMNENAGSVPAFRSFKNAPDDVVPIGISQLTQSE
jgi:hypothetical protein